MIKSFRSKPLQRLHETGKAKGLPVQNLKRVLMILALLDDARRPGDVAAPGLKFHPLPPSTRFAVWVSGNYRITFAWDGDGPVDVDLEDYH